MMQKNTLKLQIIVWILIALGAGAILILRLMGRFPIFAGNSFWSSEQTNRGETVNTGDFVVLREETFSGQINNLDVDWVSGHVTILPSTTGEIKVVQIAAPGVKREQEEMIIKGDTLEIDERRHHRWQLFDFGDRRTNLEIYLPDKVYHELEFSNVAGEIIGNNLRAQQLSFDNVAGGIAVGGEAREVEVDSVSGSVNLEAVSQRLQLDLVSGEASISGRFNDVEFDVVSGEVHLTNLVMPTRLEADVASGNIEMWIPENEGFSLIGDRFWQGLETDFALTETAGRRVYKNGAASFKLEGISGSFSLHRLP